MLSLSTLPLQIEMERARQLQQESDSEGATSSGDSSASNSMVEAAPVSRSAVPAICTINRESNNNSDKENVRPKILTPNRSIRVEGLSASSRATPPTPWPKLETSSVSEGVPSDPDFYRWLALQRVRQGQSRELSSYAGARLGILHGVSEGMSSYQERLLLPAGSPLRRAASTEELRSAPATGAGYQPSSPIISPAQSPSVVATPIPDVSQRPLESSTPMDSSFLTARPSPYSFRKRHI